MIFAPTIAAATLLALGAPLSADTYVSLMHERLVAESPAIRRLGVNPRDFVFRLELLSGRLEALGGSTPEAQRADLVDQTRLELKLDAELLVNLCPYFAAVQGFDESFYNSDPHVPPDPVAFYVPRADAQRPYGVVVLLHGRAQTETDVVSHELFRRLADRWHAILIAPWGTGGTLWGNPAAAEIAGILDELEHGVAIDQKRIYLAGISMGSSGAFHVASRYPSRFRAVLAIGGDGIFAADQFAIAHEFHERPAYVVGGRPELSAVLATSCVPVSEYAGVDERDDLYTTGDAIERAWDDMFDGTVRDANTRDCGL